MTVNLNCFVHFLKLWDVQFYFKEVPNNKENMSWKASYKITVIQVLLLFHSFIILLSGELEKSRSDCSVSFASPVVYKLSYKQQNFWNVRKTTNHLLKQVTVKFDFTGHLHNQSLDQFLSNI